MGRNATGRRWLLGLAVVSIGAAVALVLRVQRDGGLVRKPIQSSTIVMLGDSLTEGGDWARLIPTRDVSNRGYAGFTSAELQSVAEEVASTGPRAVLILAGTNDIRDGREPEWTERQLAAMVEIFERLSPETVVVIETVLPRSDAPRAVLDLNARLRSLASERGIVVLDLYPHFDDGAGGLRPEETTDGIHLSPAGYRRWAGLVNAFLAEAGL